MSSFTKPLICIVLDNMKYSIYEEFEYHVGALGSEHRICVPVGFVTDFASIPRILWSILPPNGRYTKAAVIHDWMYQNAYNSKEYADLIFYEAMLVLGVNKRIAYIMYNAVKIFGKGKYK
jgi:hypothetical protein